MAAYPVVDAHDSLDEQAKRFGSAISSAQLSAPKAAQGIVIQEAQHLSRELGGRNQGTESKMHGSSVGMFYEDASGGAQFTSPPSSERASTQSSYSSLPSHRISSKPQNAKTVASSTRFPDLASVKQESGSTSSSSPFRLGPGLSGLDVDSIAPKLSMNSPIRKLPQIPSPPSTQLTNSSLVSSLASNSTSKMTPVSAADSDFTRTPISALSSPKVQRTTGNSGGISTSIDTAAGYHLSAQSGPVVSLVMDAGKDIVQNALSSTSSSSSPSTSMFVTPSTGPSTARTKTSNSPAQPVGILKNKHARHPSGSSLSVSMRPPFQSSASSSSGINFASAFSITQSTTSSSSSFLPDPTSYLTSTSPASSTTPSSTTSPQSTTTMSSVSAFAFSPHPGSATSSVATSPTSSPLVTENAGMPYPSIHSNLNIDPLPRNNKDKGKQREVYRPDDFTSPSRPLPVSPPNGIDATETRRDGFSGGSVGTTGSSTTMGSPRSNTSTSTGTTSLHGSRPSLSQSVFQGTSSSSTMTSPLRPALRSSFSSSSLSSRYTGSTSVKGKSSRPINPTKFGPPPSSSSNSNNPPSTSSAKSPIPSSWASRPVDLNSQRPPPQSNLQHGFASSTISHSRSSSQTRTQITSSQPPRARVSSGAGATSNLASVIRSVPVLACGNRSRSGSGGMGVGGGSGLIGMGGSRNVVGGRARSHSRTRTGVGVGAVQLGGASGRSHSRAESRAESVEREAGGGDSSLKSMSVPSTPVMKSMQTAFLASSGALGSSGGSGLSGTLTSTATPLSSRPPRLLPSPVLSSKTLSNFGSSSREDSPARPVPRRLPTFDQIVIFSGLGPAQSIHTKSSSIVGPLRPRETSLTRHVAATSSRNTSPASRRLPQPSLAAHIASISASPSLSRVPSSVPTANIASTPISHPSSARDELSKMLSTTEHLSEPNLTTTSASPISPAGESPLHSHPLMDLLSPRDENDDDGDKSSLSSFRAAPRSHIASDVEGINNHYDEFNGIITEDERFSTREVFDHRDLSRSPSPIRYAVPEDSEGLFSSSEDEDLGMRRGRRGRERRTRPLMTKAVGGTMDRYAGPSESAEADAGVGGYESDGGMRRGRRMQPRSFRHSYRTAPIAIASGVESGVESDLKGSVEGGDVDEAKGGDRLWRISRAKTKTKTKDGDMEGVVKAKNKAKKAKTKRSYFDFDFDFDYLPNFKDRERDVGSRTTSSVGTSSRGTTAQDDTLNTRSSSHNALGASLSRGTRMRGEETTLEETLTTQQSDPMWNAQEAGTIFDISSPESNTNSAAAATFNEVSLHIGSTTSTAESTSSFSSHSPHITSQSGLSAHSPYTSQSNVDMTDDIRGNPQYALATSSTSSVPASPSTRPSAPYLPGSAPASPHPRRIDFQQNSAYALEVEMHGITCGLGSGPSVRRRSQSRSAQSSQANSQNYGEHSSSSRGHASTSSTSYTSARNSSKVSTPFSVFGLSRRESSMFREKNKGSNGGVKLKEKSKKELRSTGTSSSGSSRKASSLASFLSDDDPLKNDMGGAGS